MAKIVMLPCKLREDRLVPEKDAEAVSFTELEVLSRFRLDGRKAQDQNILRMLVPAAYIGLVSSRKTGSPVRFYVRNHDLSGDISWVIASDASFPSRLLEVWLVESATWESRMIEGRV